MLKTGKSDEILKQIREIEMEQEEASRYMRYVQQEEEYAYDYLRSNLRHIADEFEACHGDPQLQRLVEERHHRLQESERECGQFLEELHEGQLQIKSKCETEIDKLQWEKQRLEIT